jgi:hypothetical protein
MLLQMLTIADLAAVLEPQCGGSCCWHPALAMHCRAACSISTDINAEQMCTLTFISLRLLTCCC